MDLVFSKLYSSVYTSLSKLKLPTNRSVHFLLAVSAGSDSLALLHVLYALRERLHCKLSVVTVNHNIREKEESAQDASFVKKMCKTFFNEEIPCLVVEIPVNKVKKLALDRGKGVEEAARFLRYKAFEKARSFCKADYILTAHTKDDFYEGVLMSFFRGASPTALLGMKEQRGNIVRPLLHVEKHTLRAYLQKKNVAWREDSTNQDPSYLRNRVRLLLVKALEKTFLGWQSGVEKTLKRLDIDEEYIALLYKSFFNTHSYWKRGGGGEIYVQKHVFNSMPKAFKIRFLQEGLILLGVSGRVSYFAICSLMQIENEGDEASLAHVRICIKNEKVILNYAKQNVDVPNVSSEGYIFWVGGNAKISTKTCILNISEKKDGLYVGTKEGDYEIGPFNSPICIRTRLPGDIIKIGGRVKTLKSIFSKACIPSKISSILPIVEEGGVVRAVYGKALGVDNLIGDAQ